MMLEREMVRHDRTKSVGRVVEVVVSDEGLRVVNINRQPAQIKFQIITYNVSTGKLYYAKRTIITGSVLHLHNNYGRRHI